MPLTNKNIVFDLDETLIHSNSNMDHYKKLNLYSNPKNVLLRDKIYVISMVDVVGDEGSGEELVMWGIFRPGVFEFLQFALQYFETVQIWSAGRFLYVHSIVEKLFKKKNRPKNILTYDDTVFKTINKESMTYKPLEKIYEINKNCKPENTFIIDDRSDYEKNKDNIILIPKFGVEKDKPSFEDLKNLLNKEDDALFKLQKWFETPEVMQCNDVRKLNKKKIFK